MQPRDFVGYGRLPPRVKWPDGALVAVNLVVNYEEGSEKSRLLGDSGSETDVSEVTTQHVDPTRRDLAMESMYEYGSRAGFWRLVRLLDEYSLPCTVFGCAVAFEANPEVGHWLRDSRHDLCSHGWRWEAHWLLDPDEERERIRRAIRSFETTYGSRPLGWYCRYGPSANTRSLLVEEGGFVYDSDAYNDDLPYFTEVGGRRHLVVPYSLTYNDGQGDKSPSLFLDYCKRGLDELHREGSAGYPKMMSVGLHPRIAGQAGRANALREFIEYALEKRGVWFARRIDIARWWMEHGDTFGR